MTREDPSDIRALFARFRATGDPLARERRVLRYRPLACRLAGHYACGKEPFDDLFQVACLALIKAIDRYDPERGTAFSSYAVPTIIGELKRHYRDRTWVVRVPHTVHDNAMRVRVERETLPPRLGGQGLTRALAGALSLPEGRVRDALDALAANDIVSLDQTCHGAENQTIGDTLGADEHGYGDAEERADFETLVGCLAPWEREVVRLRFCDDLTQSDIADRVGLSQMAVSRLLKRCLPQLEVQARASLGEAA
jgi:RNA polymerase sigma-B factor